MYCYSVTFKWGGGGGGGVVSEFLRRLGNHKPQRFEVLIECESIDGTCQLCFPQNANVRSLTRNKHFGQTSVMNITTYWFVIILTPRGEKHYFFNRPNTYKLEQLMNTKNKKDLHNLCYFIKNIMSNTIT